MKKLAFFAPDNNKYCFTVMPFGPTNAPSFYTAMMRNFQTEWDNLFIERIHHQLHTTLKDLNIHINSCGEIFQNNSRLVYGSRSIIDNILLWCSEKRLVLLYFSCVCKVFKKYCVSFKLSKCNFLAKRTEYVGHDILPSGNSPASSKFNLIQD